MIRRVARFLSVPVSIAALLCLSHRAPAAWQGLCLLGLATGSRDQRVLTAADSLSAAVGLMLFLAVFFTPLPWLRIVLFIALVLFCILSYLFLRIIKQERRPEQNTAASPTSAVSGTTEDLAQRITAEKIALINKFSSVVSHELKNPLSSLKNIAYFLNKTIKTDDERTCRMIAMLSLEIDHTNTLITEMLDLSRINKINKVSSKLHELIDQAIATVKLKDTVRLTKNLVPIEATVDPERFKQIIVNLLKNAKDAMPEGGELSITMNRTDNSIDISIRDTGTGMDAKTLEHAFDPLFTTKTQVLGLGLTVTKEIVKIHNGTITLTSEQGKGTTALVVFPL